MNDQELRDFISDSLDNDPAFQVFLSNDDWVCPYCQARVPPLRSGGALEKRQELAIIGHVGRFCPSCTDGQGVPSDPGVLRKLANTLEFDLYVMRRLQQDPAWQIIDEQKNWWCPYCVTGVSTGIAGDQVDAATLISVIKKHLTGCGPFKKGKGKTQEASAIGAKAQSVQQARVQRDRFISQVKERMLKRHNWQFFDHGGAWYCPFCGEETMVQRPGGRYTLKDRLNDTVAHLEFCAGFEGGRGKERSIDEMKDIFEKRGAKSDIARKLVEEPVWRGADRWGNWICPYCRQGCVTVGLISLDAIDDETVGRVIGHLHDDCHEYPDGEIARGVEDLYSKTAREETVADKMAKLETAAAAGHKAEKELNRAKNIQEKMIPKTPKVPGLTIAPLYIAQEQVSGDFYDFIQVSEKEWGFLVADTSGHGLEAALVMSLGKKAISIRAEGEQSPLQAISVANNDIQPEILSNMFITLFYGVLNLETLNLCWIRAGHNPLIIIDPSAPNPVMEYTVDGMAVGLVKSKMWLKGTFEHNVQLSKGQTFLQYTDGVVEAKRPDSEEYEQFRFIESCRRHARKDPDDLVHALYDDVMRWTEGIPVDDDVTFLAVRIDP